MAEEWEVEEEGESLLGRSRFRRGNPEDVPFFQEEEIKISEGTNEITLDEIPNDSRRDLTAGNGMTFPNLQISQEHEDIKVEAANEIEESIDSVKQADTKVSEAINEIRPDDGQECLWIGIPEDIGRDLMVGQYMKIPNKEIIQEHCDKKVEAANEIEESIDNLKQSAAINGAQDFENVNLERILEEQETHDLYCPNCHSCITKRLILRKRKRITSRQDSFDAKFVKDATAQVNSYISGTDAVEIKDGSQDSEPKVFRCLSCFSYFIPSGNGFRLFKNFGKREEGDNIHCPDEASGRSQGWLFSIFDSMTIRKNKPESGLQPSTQDEDNAASPLVPPDLLKDNDTVGQNPITHIGMPLPDNGIGVFVDEKKKETEKSFLSEVNKDTCLEFRDVANEIAQKVVLPDASTENPRLVLRDEESERALKNFLLDVSKEDEIRSVPEEMVKDAKSCSFSPGKETLAVHHEETQAVHYEETRILVQSGEREEEAGEAPRLEILKALVYGGLLESIAGLGVISAAAGSSVRTVTVVAMGLGALAGGLPTLIHNLIELKNEQSETRYKKLLGNKSHFWAHATLAVLCFVAVGLSQPLIYGFSFRSSKYREQRLAAVAGASLAWVTILAAGKAHSQENRRKMTYFLTILKYVVLAASASGFSFLVGAVIQRLLPISDDLSSPADSALENGMASL